MLNDYRRHILASSAKFSEFDHKGTGRDDLNVDITNCTFLFLELKFFKAKINMTILVEIKNLSKKFNDNILLDDISFKLNKGEVTTLIGQNGAGKTTIAKIILGLETYDSGNLYIADQITIGYVPQILDLSFNMPITVCYIIELLAGKKNYSKALLMECFPEFEQLKNKDLAQISGGQLQKLLLAGTIISQPELIILDEPTQFLDVTSQQEFYALIGKIKTRLGITVFMISHDLFTVMKNSDQVICLNKHVCCTGKPAELYDDDNFKHALSEIGFYVHHHDHKH